MHDYKVRYTDGDSFVLHLSTQQLALLQIRQKRSFFIRCNNQYLSEKIYRANDYIELENLAVKYHLCDVCAFEDINLLGLKRTLSVIAGMLYDYPRLRSKVCFVGTHGGFENKLSALKNGELGVLKDFGLQHIIPEEQAAQFGAFVYRKVCKMTKDPTKYIATTMSVSGMMDAILLDQNDYNDDAYLKHSARMKDAKNSGHHPKGCYSVEYVVFHELGHALNNLCRLSESDVFNRYYASLSKDEIAEGLSEYALASVDEFIAEAFAEYKSVDKPGAIAKKVFEMFSDRYSEI